MKHEIIITTNKLDEIAAIINQLVINCWLKGAGGESARIDDCMPYYTETMEKIFNILEQ